MTATFIWSQIRTKQFDLQVATTVYDLNQILRENGVNVTNEKYGRYYL